MISECAGGGAAGGIDEMSEPRVVQWVQERGFERSVVQSKARHLGLGQLLVLQGEWNSISFCMCVCAEAAPKALKLAASC